MCFSVGLYKDALFMGWKSNMRRKSRPIWYTTP